MAIQSSRLYSLVLACAKLFDGRWNPRNIGISKIKKDLGEISLLSRGITLADLGLEEIDMRKFDRYSIPGYRSIYTDDNWSISLFVIPPSKKIPLHDHPEMAVVSKVIHGSMISDSFTKIDSGDCIYEYNGCEKLHIDSEPRILGPIDGNLHEFSVPKSSESCCAFIDVIAPNYDEEGGRDCTYYSYAQPRSALITGNKYKLDSNHDPYIFECEDF